MIRTPERYAGDLWRHPDQRLGSPGIYYQPPTDETRKRPARPATVRLTGPLGGALYCDPARLRYEAARLADAADTLEAMRAPVVITGTLFDLEATG
jgi:hypothetical protein